MLSATVDGRLNVPESQRRSPLTDTVMGTRSGSARSVSIHGPSGV